jgi:hypothetical protein
MDAEGTVVPADRARERRDGEPELLDDFADPRAEGAVIGTRATSGHPRLGVDAEAVLSIDNGALRIAPLIEAGFGRAVLAYGPFAPRPGLAFAVYMLNGHNTAQAEPLTDSLRARLRNWLKGSESDPRWLRVAAWLRQRRFRRTLRQFRWWRRTATRPVAPLDENLAIGWFSRAVEPDPRANGSGFVMHALGPENGELWAGPAAGRTRSLRGVQNVPLYYVAVARTEGVVYYVSSLRGAMGLAPYPWMRPVAIDPQPIPDESYLGIQQGVLGQIGFRLDTRIYGVRVGQLVGYESWCAGAHAASALEGAGAGIASCAEAGGQWTLWPSRHDRERSGAPDGSVAEMAVLDPGAPSGLIHAIVQAALGGRAAIGLVCRCLDERHYWRLELNARTCELSVVDAGVRQVVAARDLAPPASAGTRRLLILDDGLRLMAYVDGEPLADTWIADPRFCEATRVGVLGSGPEQTAGAIRRFEAHPRQTKLPGIFDMGAPWVRKGAQVEIADDFSGPPGDLLGRLTPVGGARWTRVMGRGFFELTGRMAARVRASAQEPCPGRTAYCVDWSHSEFADAEVTVTPPGTRAGQNERTTTGLILYQDTANYFILNAYRSDYYPAGSVSTFFKLGGFEDIYDAIWSNVGERVSYGKPLRLRLCCDGERYLAFIDDEPVLYRAFRDVYPDIGRLRIRKVGIVANWEFGTDTGSTIGPFSLRL